MPVESNVAVDLFDVQGRRVVTLARDRSSPGWHTLTWDRHMDGGAIAPAGIYLCRMTAGSFRAQRRLIAFP